MPNGGGRSPQMLGLAVPVEQADIEPYIYWDNFPKYIFGNLVPNSKESKQRKTLLLEGLDYLRENASTVAMRRRS